MNTQIKDLKDLFVEQSREFYYASRMEQKELPGIQKEVSNPRLKKMIERQIDIAKSETDHFEQVFEKINLMLEVETNEYGESIFKQTKKLIDRTPNPRVRDIVIINSLQKLTHNNITDLDSLFSSALKIGEREMSRYLNRVMNDEIQVDKELSELAVKEINNKALVH
jgi:ferritin-like metal-binding protein YciE